LRHLGLAEHRVEQVADLVARRDVREVELHVGALVAQVEHGEPLEEELAEDDALAEAVDQAVADALGELLERIADIALVARIDCASRSSRSIDDCAGPAAPSAPRRSGCRCWGRARAADCRRPWPANPCR